MKPFLAVVALVLLLSSSAQADWMLRLSDGTAVVWDSYYIKDSRYCTMKSYGEICWAKSDVRSIKEVPAGTETSEFGMSMQEPNKHVENTKRENAYAVDRVVSDLERQKSKRDAEFDARMSAGQARQAQEENERKKKQEEKAARDKYEWEHQRRYAR